MSLFDYKASLKISVEDPPFYAIIMAAMRKADTNNLEKLMRAWPKVWKELKLRYCMRGGILPGEKDITL